MSLRLESLHPWFQPRIVAVVVGATAVVWTTSILVGGYKAVHAPPPADPPRIDVSANATRNVAPDRVEWTLTVKTHGDTEDEANSGLHDATVAAHDYLVAQGVKEDELVVKTATVTKGDSVISTISSDGSDDNQVTTTQDTGYDGTQELTIATTDVARVMKVFRAAALADDMRNLDVSEPQCTAKNVDALEQEALGEARTAAHQRAENAVRELGGGKLGKLVNASIGSVDSSGDCSGIVVTANASATYLLD